MTALGKKLRHISQFAGQKFKQGERLGMKFGRGIDVAGRKINNSAKRAEHLINASSQYTQGTPLSALNTVGLDAVKLTEVAANAARRGGKSIEKATQSLAKKEINHFV